MNSIHPYRVSNNSYKQKIRMPSYYSSSDSDDVGMAPHKLFGRERPIYEVLGGGKVADILLWRNGKTSGALLAGMTFIWFLFQIVEYNFVSLLCHILITALLVFFIWSVGADIFKWNPPDLQKLVESQESTFREVASTFHRRFNQLLSNLFYVACGRDIPLFFLAIFSLYILSIIGSYISFLNLLYFGLVCLETLPILYERYEEEADHLVGKATHKLRKSFRRIDSKLLNKIPRGSVKDKKRR